MNINYFELLTYFIIYSFLGWIMESVIRSFCEKKIINTGFLYGPFCPIYGCGTLIMILFLENFKDTWFLLFILSFLGLTLWEYVVGVILESVFKTKYWDYSDHKFNFQGRICLSNSLFWGFLGVVFMKYIHPLTIYLLQLVDTTSIRITIYTATAIFIVDTIISILNLVNIKATLEKIEKLNAEIKDKLQELKTVDKSISKENMQNIIENMKLKRDRIFRRLYRYVYRLKKAVPAINTKEITDILSKKIEKRKKGE